MTLHELEKSDNILFKCIAGSKAFGLDTAMSDTDIKGVFYLPKDTFYGIDYIPQISNETNDIVYYELGRFVELLLKNNPNLLELLASPQECILYKHPIMNNLKLELFLSKLCVDTFAGYAVSQIKKARGLNKKIVNPIDPERKSILDFCYIVIGSSSVDLRKWLSDNNYRQQQCGLTRIDHTKGLHALYYDTQNKYQYRGIAHDAQSNEVLLSSVPKGAKEIAYLFFNVESYSAYCKDYREYWEWVGKRNTDRFNITMHHGKNYDAKNMMHTIRLLQVAEEILREGNIHVRRKNREELLSIKRGEKEYEDLLAMAEALIKQIEVNIKMTSIPEKPDTNAITAILVRMRNELYA